MSKPFETGRLADLDWSAVGVVGGLAAAIGAVGFAVSWAFFLTFYARFDLSPEDVGLDFAAMGARSAALFLPWWSCIVILLMLRAWVPQTRRLLDLAGIVLIASAVYSFSAGVRQSLQSEVILGNYSPKSGNEVHCTLGGNDVEISTPRI